MVVRKSPKASKQKRFQTLASVSGGFAEPAPNSVSANTSRRCANSLRKLSKAAVTVLEADRATIWLYHRGVSRMIGSYGCDQPFRAIAWSFADVDYQPEDRLVIADARKESELQAQIKTGCERPVAFVCRVPIAVDPDYVVSLIVVAETPRPEPTQRELHLITEIGGAIKAEFDSIKSILLERADTGRVPAFECEMRDSVSRSTDKIVLLDEKFSLCAISANAATILGQPAHELVGTAFLETNSAFGGSVAHFFARALREGVCSSDLEVELPSRSGPSAVWTIRATPVAPLDTPARFLYLTIQGLDDAAASFLASSSAALGQSPRSSSALSHLEPAAGLLFDTLIHRRSIRARDGVNYLSLRCWRQPIREFQISALKALKLDPGIEFPTRIGMEIAEELKNLLGATAFNIVVPVACGHSKGTKCLSVEIARALGRQLQIPVVQAFARQALSGSSHPRKNKDRPALRLRAPVTGNVVLVDDVASSGAHMAEAANLLRPFCGTVLPIAWIGGDATHD